MRLTWNVYLYENFYLVNLNMHSPQITGFQTVAWMAGTINVQKYRCQFIVAVAAAAVIDSMTTQKKKKKNINSNQSILKMPIMVRIMRRTKLVCHLILVSLVEHVIA